MKISYDNLYKKKKRKKLERMLKFKKHRAYEKHDNTKR